MGHSSSTDAAAAAMSVACEFVRRYPKLVYWMQNRDVEAEEVLENFRNRTQVKRWLHGTAFRRWEHVLVELIDTADTFVNHSGQAGRLVETYRQQRDSGRLDKLHPSARAVHRAVFSLGIFQGAPVLGSLRYVQTAVSVQSGGRIQITHGAVQKHIKNLVKRGLFLDYDSGKRTIYGNESGTISLALASPASEPDVGLVLDLTLTSEQRLLLLDYVQTSQERRAKLKAETEDRKQKMLASLIDPAEIHLGIDLDTDWIEVPTVTGNSVWLPHAPIDGYVVLEDGSRVDYFFALDLAHRGSCESDYLPPLMCPCTSAEVEQAATWESWGNTGYALVGG